MKKTAESLMKSIERFEKNVRIETEKIDQAIDTIDSAFSAMKEAGKAYRQLQRKLKSLQDKTDKLVHYKGFDITENYKKHESNKAMDFIDGMKTTLAFMKGMKKREEDRAVQTVDKSYINQVIKSFKGKIIREGDDLVMTNQAQESLHVTLGEASEHTYYISGITFHTKPKARVTFPTLEKLLEFFSGNEEYRKTVDTFLKRK
ncbi:MAG: hypothetical protein ACOCWO_01525 [Candidatus Muiribacteriaceae bacterium]